MHELKDQQRIIGTLA